MGIDQEDFEKLNMRGIVISSVMTAFGLVVAVILQLLQNAVMYIIDNQIVAMQKSTSMLLQSIADTDKK